MIPHVSAALGSQLRYRDRVGPKVARHHKLTKHQQYAQQDSEDKNSADELEETLWKANKDDERIQEQNLK